MCFSDTEKAIYLLRVKFSQTKVLIHRQQARSSDCDTGEQKNHINNFWLSVASRASAFQWTRHVLIRLITCEWQLYPQGSWRAAFIGLRAATLFWVAITGANQVWKVLRPAHIKSDEGIFWKCTWTPTTENWPVTIENRDRAVGREGLVH